MGVAFLADLGDFQQGGAAPQPGTHRHGPEIQPFHHQVFPKSAGLHVGALGVEGGDFIGTEQAYLPVPVPGVGIPHQAPVRPQLGAVLVRFLGAPGFAPADGPHGSFHSYPPIRFMVWRLPCPAPKQWPSGLAAMACSTAFFNSSGPAPPRKSARRSVPSS